MKPPSIKKKKIKNQRDPALALTPQLYGSWGLWPPAAGGSSVRSLPPATDLTQGLQRSSLVLLSFVACSSTNLLKCSRSLFPSSNLIGFFLSPLGAK